MFMKNNIIFLILVSCMTLASSIPAKPINTKTAKLITKEELNTTLVANIDNNTNYLTKEKEVFKSNNNKLESKNVIIGTNEIACVGCNSRSINNNVNGTAKAVTNNITESSAIIYPSEINNEKNETITYQVGDLDDRFGLPGSLVATMLG